MTPDLYVGKSGRVAHAMPSMTSGPTIQFRNIESAIWVQRWEDEKSLGKLSYCTLVRTGHIMTINPTAIADCSARSAIPHTIEEVLASRYAVKFGFIESPLNIGCIDADEHTKYHSQQDERC